MQYGREIGSRSIALADIGAAGETYAIALAAAVRFRKAGGSPIGVRDEVIFYVDEGDWTTSGSQDEKEVKILPLLVFENGKVMLGAPLRLGNSDAVIADTDGYVSGAARPFMAGGVVAVSFLAIATGSGDDWTSVVVRMRLNEQRGA